MANERVRCRKGDMKIDIKGIESRTTLFVDRDEVRQEVRDRIAARIPYLQHLMITIGDVEWPPAPTIPEGNDANG